MSEENNKLVSEEADDIKETKNIGITDNEIKTEETKPETQQTSKGPNQKLVTPQEDVSKVKIRTILKQRYNKPGSFLKKAIPLVLVAIICFAGGLIAGRGIDRHRNERAFMGGKQGMYRQLPKGNFNGGYFKGRQFNGNNSPKTSPNNKTPQVTPPAATN